MDPRPDTLRYIKYSPKIFYYTRNGLFRYKAIHHGGIAAAHHACSESSLVPQIRIFEANGMPIHPVFWI